MKTVAPGVIRRSMKAGEVFVRLDHPITFTRPVRSKGQFIIDSLIEADKEVKDRKHLANRLRTR